MNDCAEIYRLILWWKQASPSGSFHIGRDCRDIDLALLCTMLNIFSSKRNDGQKTKPPRLPEQHKSCLLTKSNGRAYFVTYPVNRRLETLLWQKQIWYKTQSQLQTEIVANQARRVTISHKRPLKLETQVVNTDILHNRQLVKDSCPPPEELIQQMGILSLMPSPKRARIEHTSSDSKLSVLTPAKKQQVSRLKKLRQRIGKKKTKR